MLVSIPMFAYDFEQKGIYYNIEDDHVSVTYSGEGVYSGRVSIPSQVTYNDVTYPVTSIGERAFEGGEDMTYLSIPSSITSIGEYAFIDCGSNIEVRIADLTAWCKVEFGNEHSSPLSSAKKLYLNTSDETKSLYIPNGVESVSNFAFYQCRSITSLNIAGSVKSIGSSAFEDCTGLTSICLSEGVESVGGSSFEGCTGLSTIILPSTLSSIALNAFKNCGNLNTIVSRIQEPFAFVDNVFSTYPTATVIVPEGTTTAYQSSDGWNLFDNITDDSSQDPTKRTIHVATAGTLPSLISADEKYIIEELTLTGELNGTDIGFIRDMSGQGLGDSGHRDDDRFSYFTTSGILKKLDITNVSIVAGGGPYYGKNKGSGYAYSYDTSNNSVSSYMFNKCQLTSVKLPTSVTSIGSYAFSGCSGLTSITIPNSVTSIGSSAFYNTGWYNLQGDGILYLDNWIIVYKGEKPIDELVITDGTKGIAVGAFDDCSGLTSVTIPNSLTSIGSYAFNTCIGLTSVTIPNSVTSIGSSVFFGCSGLASVVSKIKNPVEIGNYVFSSYPNDICATATLYVPAGKKAAYDATEGWNKFTNIKEFVDGDVNLDEKVNRIDQNALVAHIMGEKPEGFYEGLADLNGDDDVNAADVVKLIDVIGSKGLSTETEFGYDNVGGSLVVFSLTCTLNNERDEAILLTRCELYSNGSLLRTKSYSSNPVSVAAGGNKSCTFENLSKPANSTDFTVCWHYTVNGESFVYRCPLTD